MTQGMKRFWYIWDRIGVFLMIILVGIIYSILNPAIVQPTQLMTTLTRSAITGIAAAGMTFAICAGGFDLSVGSIMSVVSCIIAARITNGNGTLGTIMFAIIVAGGLGAINGIIITKLKIQTFVATLATQLAFAGVALVYSNGRAVQLTSAVNKELKFLSTGKIFNIPMPIIILFVVYGIAYLIYKKTAFGVKVRAIGSNEVATRTTGIKVDLNIIFVFVITAMTAAIAAVLNTSRLSTGDPNMGSGFELDVITAVVLGGTSLSGGRANIWGTLMGAILVTFVKMGLNMLGVGEAMQKLAIAGVLIFALTLNGIKEITQKGE